jgi:hypothetical protein
MKLQFSLATLLVCVTVLAVVCGVSINLPVYTHRTRMTTTVFYKDGKPDYGNQINSAPETVTESLPPTGPEIVRRIAWAGPLSIAATLAVLWSIRRLKSRRENGPPGG